MSTPLPWSHSNLQAFTTCPRQFEAVKVLRLYQDTKNDAALWGDVFHKEAERYIKARDPAGPLADNCESYREYLNYFIARPGNTLCEQMLGLDRNLAPCDFYDKSRIWCRGIVDVLTLNNTVALVDDHKTGKRKKDMQQLIIFALLTFYHFPQIQTAVTTYHWVSEGTKDSETFVRSQIPDLWGEIVPKLDRYMRAFHGGVFQANPSGLCRKYCPVDTCEYYGRGPRG